MDNLNMNMTWPHLDPVSQESQSAVLSGQVNWGPDGYLFKKE